jgi:hypothetical protein
VSRTTSTRRLGITAATLAAGAVAVAVPPATAAVVPVEDGQTSLHLDAATAGALGDLGVGVAPIGPATAKGLRLSFPIDGGRIDPETAAGVVDHAGGIAFRAGGTTVRVTDFTVRTDARRPYLAAKVGRGSVRLLNLDLSEAAVIRRGPGRVGTWAVRVQGTLTAQAAAALNAAFGSDIPGGIRIGRVDLRAFPAHVRFRVGDTATRVPLALDLASARIGLSNGKAVVTGATVALTPEAAAALNAAFRTSALTAGLPLGLARVVAQVV